MKNMGSLCLIFPFCNSSFHIHLFFYNSSIHIHLFFYIYIFIPHPVIHSSFHLSSSYTFMLSSLILLYIHPSISHPVIHSSFHLSSCYTFIHLSLLLLYNHPSISHPLVHSSYYLLYSFTFILLSLILLNIPLKGIYRRNTWGDRPKTNKLFHFNSTNSI